MADQQESALARRARAVHEQCERTSDGEYRVRPGLLADIESLVGAGWADWCGEEGFRARGAGSLEELADRRGRDGGAG